MTTEPEAIPADVMELAKEAHANFARSSVTDNLTTTIAHAILADRASRAPVDGAGWRPIETAPKGKQWKRPELLLWDGRRPRVGRWDEEEYAKKPRPFWSYNGSLGKTDDRSNQPTHWMPLPAAPGTHPAPASPDAEMVREINTIADMITSGNFHQQREIGDLNGWCERVQNRLRALLSKHESDRS